MRAEQTERVTTLNRSNVWHTLTRRLDTIFSGGQTTPDRTRRLLLQTPILAPTAVGIRQLLGKDTQPQTEETKERSIVFGDLRIYLDAENIPTALSYLNDEAGDQQNQKNVIDNYQREQYRRAREFAMESGFPAMTHRTFTAPSELKTTWDRVFQAADSPDNPWVTTPPKDVLTPAEAAEYGLHILNTHTPSQPKIHFRTSAFAEGGILQPLKLLNENLGEYDSKIELSIIYIDSSFLDADSMTAEQRAVFSEDEWNLLQLDTQIFKKAISEVRREKIDHVAKKINAKRQDIQNHKQVSLTEQEQLLQQLVKLHSELLALQNLTDSACYAVFQSDVGQKLRDFKAADTAEIPAVGRYFSDLQHSKIVLTGGDSQLTLGPEYYLTYMPDGTLDIALRQFHFLQEAPQLPTIQQSYPNSADFDLNTSATYKTGEYPYGGQNLLLALRHELMHAWLVNWLQLALIRGKIEQLQWFLDLTKDIANQHELLYPTLNEFATDTMAMRSFDEAWEQYLAGDDSGYQICIELPPHPLYPNGGYVLAERQDKQSATL